MASWTALASIGVYLLNVLRSPSGPTIATTLLLRASPANSTICSELLLQALHIRSL
jgi:hypothetical protein